MSERILTGDKELDAKLAYMIRTGANRAARAGLSAGARVGAKAVKKQVSADMKHIRRAVGSSVKKNKGGDLRGITTAKFGFNVGKKKGKFILEKNRGDKPGVGIGSQNIHWYVLGTGQRNRKNGGSTGSMPAQGDHIVPTALAGATGQIQAAIREKTLQSIDRQAKKQIASLGK